MKTAQPKAGFIELKRVSYDENYSILGQVINQPSTSQEKTSVRFQARCYHILSIHIDIDTTSQIKKSYNKILPTLDRMSFIELKGFVVR